MYSNLTFTFFCILFTFISIKGQKVEKFENLTITFSHKINMPVNDFFQNRMNQNALYKVAGKKFEVLYDKNDIVICGKPLSNDRINIKVDTLFFVNKRELESFFPNYYLEGETVRNIIFEHLKKIYGNEATPGNKKNIFKYYLDNNLLIVEYEQTNWRYIVNRTNKYRFIIDPLKIKVLEMEKL